MNIDLDQIQAYERELQGHLEQLAKAKRGIEYCRLQLKQTRAKVKQARQDPLIKAFIKSMPKDSVTVTPGSDLIFVSVTLACLQAGLYRDVPFKLDLKLHRHEEANPGQFGGPILKVYRSPHSPGVLFYVTEHIR